MQSSRYRVFSNDSLDKIEDIDALAHIMHSSTVLKLCQKVPNSEALGIEEKKMEMTKSEIQLLGPFTSLSLY